ncbi:MAG TPA: hypothetical protein VFO01_09020 [Trebonia sp.]|nr:hypothetical protein [Trebonia sp.]
MGTGPASAREALDMVRAGLGYLAAADAAQLSAATQAECLRELERDAAVLTAARAWILASFTAGQGYAGDADYSAVSWLIHRTGITKGAADGSTATTPERPAGGSCSHAANSLTSSSRTSRQSKPRKPMKSQKSFRSWAYAFTVFGDLPISVR